MNKEYRVYVMSAYVDLPFEVSVYHIEEWSNSTDLPKAAKDFILACEKIGTVYSLLGFQNACNIEEVSTINTWIFITDKY